MLKYSQITLALFLSLYLTLFCTEAFIPPTHKLAFARSKNACGPAHAKGFSKEEKMAPKPKTEGAIKREAERSKYDDLSSTGGQEVSLPKEEMKEADCVDPRVAGSPPSPFKPFLTSPLPITTQYTIFVRLFGQDDDKWIPAGAVAVPRGEQVAKAIYSNEEGIKKGILRTFPGMKEDSANFEFGYNLKIYPDDPIQLAVKPTGEISGFSAVTKWFDALLSPVDTSDVGKQ